MTDIRTPLFVGALSKRYANTRVLERVSLTIAAGETVALIGPNGAGKSTLVECIVGRTIADEGRVLIDGVDLAAEPIEARKRLRYLPQDVEVPEGLTGHDYLQLVADVFAEPTGIDALIAASGLGAALDMLASTYSVGMRKRLAFAALACGDASLFVLDEPFAGLDREGRDAVVQVLRDACSRGAGVLLTGHDREDGPAQLLSPRWVALAELAGALTPADATAGLSSGAIVR